MVLPAIDTDARAIKPCTSVQHSGTVLHRETASGATGVNIQHHYTPDEAIEIGRALVQVGQAMLDEKPLIDGRPTD